MSVYAVPAAISLWVKSQKRCIYVIAADVEKRVVQFMAPMLFLIMLNYYG
ncbi:hypothetical protein LDG_8994 [Legionella drancourtii LLAP12]|uniref:Uncharacterized protein n=1 Tax=Legionella drancourtii LLAP12 TaxID=658187 RepID=G9EUJ9_9GAMM|nr:hypothetical protein LDG_8994 [Legionella drancourtii LLAP12]